MRVFATVFALNVLALVAAFLVALGYSAAHGAVPVDMPCINWKASSVNVNTPDINDIFIASNAWVMEYSPQECSVRGQIIPCWSTDSGNTQTFGHHDFNADYIPNDYCRIFTNETGTPSVYQSSNFLLPFKGPMYKTHKFILTQTGASVPDDVIRVGNRAMAMSTMNGDGQCAGIGFTGWAEILQNPDGSEVFGNVHFSIVAVPITTQTFQVAVCTSYTNPPPTTTPAPPTLTPPPPTTPTPLPNTKPYIRFAHAVPTTQKVTATITQGSVTKTWSCYSFAQFSNWDQQFVVGNGAVTISGCGANASTVYVNQTIFLSPGPLVVLIKGYWPLNEFSIEAVAASYVPAQPGMSGVRLFNLIPDYQMTAGLTGNGKQLVDGVKFTLGSIWAPVQAQEEMTFAAIDDQTSKTLCSNKFQAPASPMVFTQFLVGLANASSSSVFAPQMVSLIDAPEL